MTGPGGAGRATGPDVAAGGDGPDVVTEPGIRWASAGWVFPAGACALIGAFAVVAVGRADLVVFAAPLVGALAGGWWTADPPRALRVRAALAADRVLEGDPVTLTLELGLPDGVELVCAWLDTGPGLRAAAVSWEPAGPGASRGRCELTTVGWGRSPCLLRVRLRGGAGLMVGEATGELPTVTAFPVGDPLGALPWPMELPDLIGAHVSRRRGAGVEFAGIRGYLPGDPLRAVNWPVTARRGRLHVTERLAEQAATVVAMIDASADVTQPGRPTLEVSVQGALAVTQAAVGRGDRAGVLALGGAIRWMAPGLGRRHLHRVVEALVDVQAGGGTAPADVAGYPRAVLPPGAAVVAFSPLVDDRALAALADMAHRGFALVVVDVLRTAPRARPDSAYDPIAVRMWGIRRRGMRHRLAELGIPVVAWPADAELEAVLRPLSRRPLVGGRR